MALQTQVFSTGDYAWHSWSNGYMISLALTEESVDVANNTSQVSYLFTISNTGNNRFYDNGWNWTISIGGHTIAISDFDFYVYPYHTTQTIASGELTVAHNADGTLEMPYSVGIPNVQNWNSYGPPAMSLSGTWALTTISRQAVLTDAPNFTDEDNPTISYVNSGGDGVESLQACISLDGERAAISYRDVPKNGNSYMFTLTEVDRFVLQYSTTDVNSRPVFFCLKTVIDGVSYVDRLERTLTIVNAESTLEPSVVDSNGKTVALTGNANERLIKFYSNATATATYAGSKGAEIDAYTVSIGGYDTKTTSPAVFEAVESGVFTFSVKDSRGNITQRQVEKTLIPYVKLTCNLSKNKPEADGSMMVQASGNCFRGSFGATSNSLTVQCRYRVGSGSYGDWITMTTSFSGNSYTAQVQLTGLNYKAAYTFQARAIDKLETVTSVGYTARALPVFDWGENDFNVNGTLNVNGEPALNTGFVRTYFYQTSGAISPDSVVEFMATVPDACAFIVKLSGSGNPAHGTAIGVVHNKGADGAFTLYDSQNGVRSRRVSGGVLYT